jgi:hypothetical protein
MATALVANLEAHRLEAVLRVLRCAPGRHSSAGSVQLRAASQRPVASLTAVQAVANGKLHSVRVGLYYRALGIPVSGGVHWFWIGIYAQYNKLVA